MRKELAWAGIIGILFGVAIGFGVWRAHSSVSENNKPTPSPSPKAEVGDLRITIAKPEDFGVITESPTGVSGITKSSTLVVISTNDGDFITTSLEDGSFLVDADLLSGINFIKATSVDSNGITASQGILAVYSSSFQANLSTPEESTDEADIQKAVELRLAQAQKSPKAYIGTVTDISEDTIQIRSIDSQIQQIATDKFDVTVVNIKGSTNKIVKTTDIAIGDFIAALGYIDGNEVLDAQRILITNSIAESKIDVSLLKVSDTGTKSFTANALGKTENITITPDKNTVIKSYLDGKTKTMKFTDIDADDTVIVVSDITGSPALIRSIFDLSL